MNETILWRLILAHVVADFPLQPDALIAAKRKVWGVILHAGIFGLTSVFSLGDNIEKQPVLIAVGALVLFHGLVDYAKTLAQKATQSDSIWLFLCDQGLHIGSILLVAYLFRFTRISAAPAYPPFALAVIAIWAVPIILELIRSEVSGENIEPHIGFGRNTDKLALLENMCLFAAGFRLGWFLLAILIIIPRIIQWAKGRKIGITPISWILALSLGIVARFLF